MTSFTVNLFNKQYVTRKQINYQVQSYINKPGRALFVNKVLFSFFLGCPFINILEKIDTEGNPEKRQMGWK